MDTIYRKLRAHDREALWRINEEGVPGVGKVTQEALADLVGLCELALGAFQDGTLVGFVLCLVPGSRYGSPNYAWFSERYASFLYVDRIAVSDAHRDSGVGSSLYRQVFDYAEEREWPVSAEVNIRPPNPGSMRFHDRHFFSRVGVLEHGSKAVAMLVRPVGKSA